MPAIVEEVEFAVILLDFNSEEVTEGTVIGQRVTRDFCDGMECLLPLFWPSMIVHAGRLFRIDSTNDEFKGRKVFIEVSCGTLARHSERVCMAGLSRS